MNKKINFFVVAGGCCAPCSCLLIKFQSINL